MLLLAFASMCSMPQSMHYHMHFLMNLFPLRTPMERAPGLTMTSYIKSIFRSIKFHIVTNVFFSIEFQRGVVRFSPFNPRYGLYIYLGHRWKMHPKTPHIGYMLPVVQFILILTSHILASKHIHIYMLDLNYYN